MLTGNPKFNNKYGNPVGNDIYSSLINFLKKINHIIGIYKKKEKIWINIEPVSTIS